MYTITLINTICYIHSSHCISITLQTCTEQQHNSGSNTKNGYVYICRTQRYLPKLFMTPDTKGIETIYALIYTYIIKILSQAVTLVALFTPTCFDPYGSSSGSTAGPC